MGKEWIYNILFIGVYKDIVWEFLGRCVINIYDGNKKIIFGWY